MEKTASSSVKKRALSTSQMALIGVMTAVTCILGPFAIPIPISPVPISFTNLAVYLTVYVLGMKAGTISYLIYLLLGFAGLPVFSGFTGGVAKLAGPTGGYLVGFIFMAVIAGWFIDHFQGNRIAHVAGDGSRYGSMLRLWYGLAGRPAGNQLYGWAGSRCHSVSAGGCRQNSAGCIDRADTQEGNTEAEQTVEAQRIVKRYVTVYTAVCREV